MESAVTEEWKEDAKNMRVMFAKDCTLLAFTVFREGPISSPIETSDIILFYFFGLLGVGQWREERGGKRGLMFVLVERMYLYWKCA